MIASKMISALLFALIGSVTGLPEHLICCTPERGSLQIQDDVASCWHEELNKTNSVPLNCPLHSSLAEKFLNLTITESGDVYHIDSRLPNSIKFRHGEFCFGNGTDEETGEIEKVVVLCTEEAKDETTLGWCMLVSAIFFFLTAAVYAALHEVRDLQGKSIINFCASMGLGLAILAYAKLFEYSDMTLCAIRGFLIYFFLIASFFWTNAISIQVLLSLSFGRPLVNNYGWKEFSWYALYAWGCPTILTVAMAIVNYYPGDHIKPGIGWNTCWFFDESQQWLYMYSVMTILIVSNICIFIYTSIGLWRYSFSSSHIKALKYKFVMTIRLVTIMGLPWIFEMISSLVKGSFWFILDVFNALQGPLVFFLIVVFRKRVVKAMLKRGWLDCVAAPVERALAVREDDEEGVVQHTLEISMNGTNRNDV